MQHTKLIQCKCNNNHIVYAHTEIDSSSVYGFKSIFEVVGFSKLDHFNNVICVCGKKHSIKRFVNWFHSEAVKESTSPLMVEGEGAPQYMLPTIEPAKDTQLALL